MLRLGGKDPRLVVLVGDIGSYGLRDFATAFPGRFVNAGIREQAMASAAAGLALTGFVPVIHSIAPFVVERCFEQIKDGFSYHGLSANIVSVGAGFDYAALGCTHHSYSDLALMKSLPGSQVFYPGSPAEFDSLFEENYASGKVNYFRLAGRTHSVRLLAGEIRAGRGYRVQEGADITFVVVGPLLDFALQATHELACSSEVLYMPSIKPFDAGLLCASVRKTGRLVVAEDHSVYGGLADEVRRSLTGVAFPYRMVSLGVQDKFIREYGSFDHLAGAVGVGVEAMVVEAKRLLEV